MVLKLPALVESVRSFEINYAGEIDTGEIDTKLAESMGPPLVKRILCSSKSEKLSHQWQVLTKKNNQKLFQCIEKKTAL